MRLPIALRGTVGDGCDAVAQIEWPPTRRHCFKKLSLYASTNKPTPTGNAKFITSLVANWLRLVSPFGQRWRIFLWPWLSGHIAHGVGSYTSPAHPTVCVDDVDTI
jgi:hypothetical protein